MINKDKTITQLEEEIKSIIFNDNGCTATFEYNEIPNQYNSLMTKKHTQVVVRTFNSSKDETFIMCVKKGASAHDALNEVINYLKLIKKSGSSYTVRWRKKGEHMPLQSSYFYCDNILQVVDRFFTDKNVDEYVVDEIKMNPIS